MRKDQTITRSWGGSGLWGGVAGSGVAVPSYTLASASSVGRRGSIWRFRSSLVTLATESRGGRTPWLLVPLTEVSRSERTAWPLVLAGLARLGGVMRALGSMVAGCCCSSMGVSSTRTFGASLLCKKDRRSDAGALTHCSMVPVAGLLLVGSFEAGESPAFLLSLQV